MKQIPIALQLYTVREETSKDLAGTLARLSEIGYTKVELAGTYGLTATQLKPIFEAAALKPVSAHVGLHELEGADVGDTIEMYLNLGVFSLIVPHIGEDVRLGGSGYGALAERLNSVGELLIKYGITVGYHNHDFEFRESHDGKLGIEMLIDNTDPSLVTFEIDTYWALLAGTDPAAFITKHGSRISLLHIKDMDPDDRLFAPIGTGLLPLEAIVAASVEAGVRYLIVEQDTTKGPSLEAVKISLDNLKTGGYM